MAKHHDSNTKQIILNSIRTSGLTITEACQAHHISRASYYRWLKQAEGKGDAHQTDTPAPTAVAGARKITRTKPEAEVTPQVEEMICSLKQQYPYYGLVKISQHLRRFAGVHITPTKVLKVLEKHHLPLSDFYAPKQPKEVTRFERSQPNELWATDLMVYRLKGGQRLYFIAWLDDYSRFVLGHGVFASGEATNVVQVFQEAVRLYGLPREVLTDQGRQFHSWNGLTEFEVLLANWGVKHTMTRPHNPGCNGKIESLHRNLQRELLRRKEFASLEEAKREIAAYIRYYNHERPHQGIGGLTPADRYFGLSEEVNKYALHPNPYPRTLYLTGKVEDAVWRLEELPQGGIALSLNGQELKRWPATHDWPLALLELSCLGEEAEVTSATGQERTPLVE